MSTPSTLIQSESAGKLVPSSEIREAPAQQNFPPWAEYLGGIAHQIEQENQAEEMQRIRKIVRNHHYYRGRQSGYFSIITGQYQDIDDSDVLYTKNYVRALTKKKTAQWSRSKTEFRVRARSDKQEKRDGARMADKIGQFYQETLFPETTKQREGKFVTLAGESFRCYYWSQDAGRLIDVPEFEERPIKLTEDSYTCYGCGAAGAANPGTSSCPSCGGVNLSLTPGVEASVKVITGYKKVREGDAVLEVVDPIEVKIDLHARSIDESSYLRRKRLVRSKTMKSKFPWFDLPESGGGAANEALHFQNQLEVSPGNTSSGTTGTSYAIAKGSYQHMCDFSQYWVDPTWYEEYVFQVDTPVGKGKVMNIPKGTKAKDLFPEGLYFARSGEQLIDCRNEDKKPHWAHIVDDLIPNAIHGDGSIDDVIELQDLLNDVHSLRFEYLMRCTVPPLFYDKRMCQGEQIQNRPGDRNPIQNIIPGMKISDGFYQLQAQGLDNHVDLFIEQTQRDMVEFIGAFATDAAAPDTKNGTATAAQLAHDTAQGLSAQPLAIKAEADQRTLMAVLEMVREHWDGPRFLPLLGSHGMIEGHWFEASNIPEDFVLSVVPYSWMPRNETERRNDFIASMQVSPALPLGPYTPGLPGFLQRVMGERFNMEIDEDSYSMAARYAMYKMNKLRELAEGLEQQGVAEMGLEPQMVIQMLLMQVPVNPRTDKAGIADEVIVQWLMSDAGIQASPFIQEVMNARIDEIGMQGAMWQQKQGMLQMAAQGPMLAMQGGAGNGQPPGGEGPPQGGSNELQGQ